MKNVYSLLLCKSQSWGKTGKFLKGDGYCQQQFQKWHHFQFHRHTLEMDPKEVRLTGKRNRSSFLFLFPQGYQSPPQAAVLLSLLSYSFLPSDLCSALAAWGPDGGASVSSPQEMNVPSHRVWESYPCCLCSSHSLLGDRFDAGGGGGLLIYLFSIFPSSFSLSQNPSNCLTH